MIEKVTTVPLKSRVIYMTTNVVNGKRYIGKDQNNNPKYLGSGYLFKRALKKYGKENFVKQILDFCCSDEHMNAGERYFIALYGATSCDNYYNIASGGDGGNLIAGLSPERRLQLNKENSLRQIGRKPTEETRAKMRLAQNLPHNVAKKSQVHKGLKHTDEVKARISKTLTGQRVGDKHPLFGKHHTKASKKKTSKSSKEVWLRPGFREMMKIKLAEAKIKYPPKRGKDTWNFGVKRPEHSVRMSGAGNPHYGKSIWGKVRMTSLTTGEVKDFENPSYASYYAKEKYNSNIKGCEIAKSCKGKWTRSKIFKWEFIDV